MDQATNLLLTNAVQYFFSSDIATIDKLIMFFMSIVGFPYIVIVIRKMRTDITELPKFHDKKRTSLQDNFPNNVLRNKLIQTALEKMVYEASADKAYILQFHNGGENIKGVPFIKFSMTNEWCPIGVARESHLYQNVPIGIFSGLSYLAIRNKKLYFPDVEDLRAVDSGSYAIFKSKNVSSVHVAGTFDLNGVLLGLVIMEHFDSTSLNEESLLCFEKTAATISGLVLCKDGEDPDTCII